MWLLLKWKTIYIIYPECMSIALSNQHTKRTCLSSVPCPAVCTIFCSPYLINDTVFRQDVFVHWMSFFIFSTKYCRNISFSKYNSAGCLCFSLLNPLNPELNPICYLLALLGAHHFLHVSRIRVKLLKFRLLMSYIYIYIWSTHFLCF